MKKITFLFVALCCFAFSWHSNAQFTENFDASTSLPAGWSVINGGGANQWTIINVGTSSAHSGTNIARINYNLVAHDDYLITPAITVTTSVNDRISFFIKSLNSGYLEPYEVLLSTTTNTAAGDFSVVLQAEEFSTQDWEQKIFSLNDYVGQTVYIAIRATGTDEDRLAVDDFVNDTQPTGTLDYYNLQFPATGTIAAGDAFDVYAQAYEAGLTDATAGQAPGIEAWIGYSTADTDPSGTEWTWIAADFNVETGNNDEYTLNLGSVLPGPGTYYYASRWSLEEGPYTYGGILADGSNGGTWGENNNISGVLTVNSITNDECDGAISLTVNSDLACGVMTSSTTVGASASSQEDDVSGTPNNDVWFSFVATNTYHQISLTDVVAVVGTATDMGMAIYDGSGGCNALIFTATSDPDTLTVADLTIGTTYYVRVYGWADTNTAQTNFNICVGIPPPPPVNDTCNNALVLTESIDDACGNVVNGTTVDAIASASDTCSASSKDVWYSFTPSQNSSYNFTVTEITDFGSSSTYVTLYSGTCGSLEQIGSSCSTTSLFSSQLASGTTYYVNIRSTSSTAGVDFSLCAFPIITPENDECVNATMLTVDADLSCSNPVDGTTIDATQSLEGCEGTANDDVWYSFVAIGSAHSIIINNTSGSADIVTEVFEGCEGASLVCQDFPNSPVDLTGLTAGNTYYFRIYTYTSTASTRTSFTVCVGTPPPPPANDECVDAIALTPGLVYSDNPIDGTVLSATYDAENVDTCGSSGPGVWYSVVVPGDGNITIEIGADAATGDTGFDSVIEVFSGVCGSLVSVDCNDDGSLIGVYSMLDLSGLAPGSTIYVKVWEYGGNDSEPFSISAYSATLSVGDVENQNAFTYFPNPVKNELNLRAQNTIQNVSIFNMLGQEVLKSKPNTLDTDVDMAALQSGAYFVKVTINDVTETVRVIKQ